MSYYRFKKIISLLFNRKTVRMCDLMKINMLTRNIESTEMNFTRYLIIETCAFTKDLNISSSLSHRRHYSPMGYEYLHITSSQTTTHVSSSTGTGIGTSWPRYALDRLLCKYGTTVTTSPLRPYISLVTRTLTNRNRFTTSGIRISPYQ